MKWKTLMAGLLVVFNVVNKEEKKFVPPKPVDRRLLLNFTKRSRFAAKRLW